MMKILSILITFSLAVIAATSSNTADASDPSYPVTELSVRIITDKQIYAPGEELHITVIAENNSNHDITLNFPSSYQADYIIDGAYRWSVDKAFIQVLTQVTIEAGASHKWEFVHTAYDYPLPVGQHTITAEVVGQGPSRPITISVAEHPVPQPVVARGVVEKIDYSAGMTMPSYATHMLLDINGNVLNYLRSGWISSTDPRPDLDAYIGKYVELEGYPEPDYLMEPTTTGYPDYTPDILRVIRIKTLVEVSANVDMRSYDPGEDVQILVRAHNRTNEDIRLMFTSSLQADYVIDNGYRWSDDKAFTDALTYVTVPAGGHYDWEFVHTAEDYYLKSGIHTLIGEVTGYGRSQPASIHVQKYPPHIITAVGVIEKLYTFAPGGPTHVLTDGTLQSSALYYIQSDTVPLDRFIGDYVKIAGLPDPDDPTMGPMPRYLDVIALRQILRTTVTTDKSVYRPDQPVKVLVTAHNMTEHPIVLNFSSTYQADYVMDGVFRWSEGKAFARVLTSVEVPAHSSHTWKFDHPLDEYPLVPGDHHVMGRVEGYGFSHTKYFKVEEGAPQIITVRGVIKPIVDTYELDPATVAPWPLPTHMLVGPMQGLLYYLRSSEVDLTRFENIYSEVTGYPVLDPRADSNHVYQTRQMYVRSVEPLIITKTFTNKPQYLFKENVKITVRAVNVSDEDLLMTFGSNHQSGYRIDGQYQSPGGVLPVITHVKLPAGSHHDWEWIHTPEDYLLKPGQHAITGYSVGYGQSKPAYVRVKMEQPGSVIADGIIENARLSTEISGGTHILTDRLTGQPLYSLVSRGNDLDRFVGMYVKIWGHRALWDTNIGSLPLLDVFRVKPLLKVSVQTARAVYAPGQDVDILITAFNPGPKEITLVFSGVHPADYRLDGEYQWSHGKPAPEIQREINIPPFGTHQWKLMHLSDEYYLEPGPHSVEGIVTGYGRSKPLPFKVAPEHPAPVVVRGIIERQGMTTYQYGTHVLIDPLVRQVTHALRSDVVELDKYIHRFAEVTGYLVPGYPVEGGPPLLDVRKVETIWSPYQDRDSDGDQIPDSWEIANGLDPDNNDANSDIDGDGVPAISEFSWGSDPNSARSCMKKIEIRPDALTRGMTLKWNCVPGKIYQVYYSDGAPGPGADWKPLGGPLVFEDADELTVVDQEATTGSGKSRFYRVGVVEY